MQANSIAYSMDEFSQSLQQSNGNSLGIYRTGFTIDIRSDADFQSQESDHRVLRNGNSFEERCEDVIQILYEQIAPTLQKHPTYRLWRRWSEEVSTTGMKAEHQHFWERAYQQALTTLASLESMYLGEQEWTFETAVADRLLDEGTNMYLESLEELRNAPGEQSLAWLEEALFYLLAVEQWKLERV